MTTIIRNFFSLRPVRKNVPLRAARVGAIAIVLSQLLDYLTTTIGIQLGAVETNPIIAPIVTNWALFLLIKVAATSFLLWATWKRPLATTLIAGLYLLVGINNLFVLSRLF